MSDTPTKKLQFDPAFVSAVANALMVGHPVVQTWEDVARVAIATIDDELQLRALKVVPAYE